MRLALQASENALGRTAPNPPVGCVLVRAGKLIASGFTQPAGQAHAEVEALRAAKRRARGCTAYVTLEPCSHTGRTGPCADALIEAGIARVVVGVKDPNPLVAGRGLRKLRRAGISVRTGVLAKDCRDRVRGFTSLVETGRPWVHLKLAATLDGRIATRTGDSRWISSVPSRALVQQMRQRAEAILVGVGTVLSDDPRLTCRLPKASGLLRVILDPECRTPPSSRVVAGRGPCLVVGSKQAPLRRARALERAGAEVLVLDTRGKRGWERLLRQLGQRQIMELLVEGGSSVATSAVKADVVNSLSIFYNPRFFGGDGIPMMQPLGVRRPDQGPRYDTVDVRCVGGDVLWNGERA